MSRLATAFLLAGLASLVACTSETSPEAHAADSAAQPASAKAPELAAPADARQLEAGCASCTFKMAGAEGCKLAVKVDDKPYLVTGANVDAHAIGLCDGGPKTALVAGSVQGGEFVATSFTLKP